MKNSIEHWWNDIGTGTTKYSKKSVSQCHFLHNKTGTELPEFMKSAFNNPVPTSQRTNPLLSIKTNRLKLLGR